MNKQRKVLITTTYNEMGIIIDTKAEKVAQQNLQPTCNQLATDVISRQVAINDLQGKDPSQIWDTADIEVWVNALPSAQPEPKWIPVKFRPMDSEEREYWGEQFGEELADEDAVMFDCPMPEDGQEILVSYRKCISMDKCEIDGGCYGLEGNGDWDGVIAWMPQPEPYKG